MKCLKTHHGYKSANEPKVEKMVRIDTGSRVDLETVVVVAGVLEQAVHRVQHLWRKGLVLK